ncbi:glycosyltransferase [candidate division KSB1 bacterium]
MIIPARNEEDNISKCLQSIINQDYPEEKVTIIIVNDHSKDNTIQKAENIISEFLLRNITIIDLKSNDPAQSHKKEAIEMAIDTCKSDLIITTDADCWMGEKWISTVVSYIEQYKPKMVVSPVVFGISKGLFQGMQAMEFNSLIASTAGAIGMKLPIMANGANLAFFRDAFKETDGYNREKEYASGDDVFLLHNFKRNYGNASIHFLKNRDAIVYTKAAESLKTFYNQRVRWTSKSIAYQDKAIILTAVCVYLMNFCLLTGLIIGCFNISVLYITAIAFILKLIVDLPILISYTLFTKQKMVLKYIPLLLLFYPIYIIIIGTLGNFMPYKWRGK